MEILSRNQIDALAENYPIGAQEGLDTLVCCKLLYPDRRNNPEGYWYIPGCTRRGDDVEFEGLCTVAGNVGTRIAPVVFTLSGLERLTSKGQVIEVDNNFTPATVRELQKTEAPLQHYIKAELEKERRALIWASRQDLAVLWIWPIPLPASSCPWTTKRAKHPTPSPTPWLMMFAMT